jgi:hypothetical protein
MSAFAFRVHQWLERSTSTAAENATYCELIIEANGTSFTQVHDIGARTVQEGVRVAASSLAQWLAWNRWRLLYDVSAGAAGEVDWRLSHCMAAAGGGYLWPAMEFSSDGDFVQVRQVASSRSAGAPIEYLRTASFSIERGDFERAVDDFLRLVCERLIATGESQDEVVELIRSVQEEAISADDSSLRQVEALLRHDPDVLDPAFLRQVRDSFLWTGKQAMAELLAASSVDALAPLQTWAGTRARKGSGGLTLNRDFVREMSATVSTALPGELPWERGRAMAAAVRNKLRAGVEPLQVREVLGLRPGSSGSAVLPEQLQATGFVGNDGHVSAFIAGTRSTSGDFQLARILADALLHATEDVILPCTTVHSARQKLQRAFAQELLCPIDGLLPMFRRPEEPQESEVDAAAKHFGVSPWTVQTTLVNHGYTSREFLPRG